MSNIQAIISKAKNIFHCNKLEVLLILFCGIDTVESWAKERSVAIVEIVQIACQTALIALQENITRQGEDQGLAAKKGKSYTKYVGHDSGWTFHIRSLLL